MCYSPNVVNRVGGNTHDEERLVLALMGKHGPNPTRNGISFVTLTTTRSVV